MCVCGFLNSALFVLFACLGCKEIKKGYGIGCGGVEELGGVGRGEILIRIYFFLKQTKKWEKAVLSGEIFFLPTTFNTAN